MIRRLLTLLAAFVLLGASAAQAHEMTMAEMQLREMAPGEFAWQWTASEKGTVTDDLTPHWPEGCAVDQNVLHCGRDGLRGTLAIDGVGERYSATLVKVFWLDGQSRVYTLTAGQPRVTLYGAADDRRGIGEIARAYTVLGIEHILGGIDHLCSSSACCAWSASPAGCCGRSPRSPPPTA